MNPFDGELAELHRLQVDYGREWRIWRSTPSPSGRSGWYATRRRYSDPDVGRGLWPTLGADTAEELREELDAQARAAETPQPSPSDSRPQPSPSADPLPYELMRWGIPGHGSYMLPEAFG